MESASGFNAPNQIERETASDKVASLFQDVIFREFVHVPEEVSGDGAAAYVAQDLIKRGAERFPELSGEIATLITAALQENPGNNLAFARVAGSRLAQQLLSHYPLADLETRLREQQAQANGWTILNEILLYGVDGNDLHLHIAMNFTRKPHEQFALFLDGLRKVAEQLQQDNRLENVTLVSGRSWLIYKFPQLMERQGFSIVGRDEQSEEATAEMSKDKFIEAYGSKEK